MQFRLFFTGNTCVCNLAYHQYANPALSWILMKFSFINKGQTR